MTINLKSDSLMFVISSPSGAGKTSLSRAMLASDGKIKPSISVTTRPARSGEIDGKDYYFIDNKQYNELLTTNMLLEHTQIYDHCYGTPTKQTKELLASGYDVLYTLDLPGLLSMKKIITKNVISIFILPPSLEILESRLRNRKTDSDETIQKRLKSAKSEINNATYYDHVIINDIFEDSLEKLKNIINSTRSETQYINNLDSTLLMLTEEINPVSETEITNETLIDVRSLGEWQNGHIAGAIHIPLPDLFSGENELNKNTSYVIYCQHGVRSLQAAKFLKEQGFQNISHLDGGLVTWKQIRKKIICSTI